MSAGLHGRFLLVSQVNYPATYLAEHLEGLPHDNVPCFLQTQRVTPRQLWQPVRAEVVLSERGYVLFDDTVPAAATAAAAAAASNSCAVNTGATPTA